MLNWSLLSGPMLNKILIMPTEKLNLTSLLKMKTVYTSWCFIKFSFNDNHEMKFIWCTGFYWLLSLFLVYKAKFSFSSLRAIYCIGCAVLRLHRCCVLFNSRVAVAEHASDVHFSDSSINKRHCGHFSTKSNQNYYTSRARGL